MLAKFDDKAENSQIYIHDSNFTKNCPGLSKHKAKMVGGGMAVTILKSSVANMVLIAACIFDGNSAPTGRRTLCFFRDITGTTSSQVTHCQQLDHFRMLVHE